MTHIGVIPKDLATGILWPQIESLIARSEPYGRGEFTASDILDGIKSGNMFALGVVEDGAVVFVLTATVVEYPRKRVLYVQSGAGRGSKLAKEALISAAKTLEVDWIETRCRASIARIYRSIGFDTAYQVAILEIQK